MLSLMLTHSVMILILLHPRMRIFYADSFIPSLPLLAFAGDDVDTVSTHPHPL